MLAKLYPHTVIQLWILAEKREMNNSGLVGSLWASCVSACLPHGFSHTHQQFKFQIQVEEESLQPWLPEEAETWRTPEHCCPGANRFSSFWEPQTLCPQINRHILSLSRKMKTAQPAFKLGGIPLLHLKKKSHPKLHFLRTEMKTKELESMGFLKVLIHKLQSWEERHLGDE